jgi:hypothetical protein
MRISHFIFAGVMWAMHTFGNAIRAVDSEDAWGQVLGGDADTVLLLAAYVYLVKTVMRLGRSKQVTP